MTEVCGFSYKSDTQSGRIQELMKEHFELPETAADLKGSHKAGRGQHLLGKEMVKETSSQV